MMIQYITAPPPPIISANDDLIYNFTTTWRGGAHSLVAAPRAPESLRDEERKRGRQRRRKRERDKEIVLFFIFQYFNI